MNRGAAEVVPCVDAGVLLAQNVVDRASVERNRVGQVGISEVAGDAASGYNYGRSAGDIAACRSVHDLHRVRMAVARSHDPAHRIHSQGIRTHLNRHSDPAVVVIARSVQRLGGHKSSRTSADHRLHGERRCTTVHRTAAVRYDTSELCTAVGDLRHRSCIADGSGAGDIREARSASRLRLPLVGQTCTGGRDAERRRLACGHGSADRVLSNHGRRRRRWWRRRANGVLEIDRTIGLSRCADNGVRSSAAVDGRCCGRVRSGVNRRGVVVVPCVDA